MWKDSKELINNFFFPSTIRCALGSCPPAASQEAEPLRLAQLPVWPWVTADSGREWMTACVWASWGRKAPTLSVLWSHALLLMCLLTVQLGSKFRCPQGEEAKVDLTQHRALFLPHPSAPQLPKPSSCPVHACSLAVAFNFLYSFSVIA